LHAHEDGGERIEALGRAAALKRVRGVPANVIPLGLWHVASTGIDLWLSAIAYGASQVAVLLTGAEAPQYVEALRREAEIAQAILSGFGYAGPHIRVLQAASEEALDGQLADIASLRPDVPPEPAHYAVGADKRTTLELALAHFAQHAPQRHPVLPMPAGAPFGTITVDADRCTLCMSCVGACPAGALQDTPTAPQLKFIEANCVQCGLCASTCPEDAITLQPRLLLEDIRKQPRVVCETQPYACIRCGKPFGTLKGVETMLQRLSTHSMFQGRALERLRMCADCRVIDIHTATDEVRITDA
jgi:ferredoxin